MTGIVFSTVNVSAATLFVSDTAAVMLPLFGMLMLNQYVPLCHVVHPKSDGLKSRFDTTTSLPLLSPVVSCRLSVLVWVTVLAAFDAFPS